MNLSILTWNISGFKRNKFNLQSIIEDEDPSLIFISEPWLHLSDSAMATDNLDIQYNSYLNSEDRHDDLLSLHKSRAHGGTLTLWKKELDPYVTLMEPASSRILVLVLDVPGYQITIHINIYLSTAGKDSAFMEDLALLEDTIDQMNEKYPDSLLFIRGDANSSPTPRPNNKRDDLLAYFLTANNLKYLPTNHKTYHHFTNDGNSDSNIDVLIQSEFTSNGFPNLSEEKLIKILCSKTNSLIDSSHDALISSVFLPITTTPMLSSTIRANRVSPTKHKIIWSAEGIQAYQELLQQTLPALQLNGDDELLPGGASLLFQLTNHILSTAATLTNDSRKVSSKAKDKRIAKVPEDISEAMKNKAVAHAKLRKASRDPSVSESEKTNLHNNFKIAKVFHQNLVRKHHNDNETKRDNDFQSLLSKNPAQVFKNIKSMKSRDSKTIKLLRVGDKTYTDDAVADGFFDSISSLKTLPPITSPSFDIFAEDYRHIIEICKSGEKIPRISLKEANDLLLKIRPSVTDFFSISANHYINGGPAAIAHFRFLFNLVLENIELAAIEEMNRAHAVILYKRHGKDKTIDSSYRTISSCPFISKCIDIYLGQLSRDDWKTKQAETQFQGEGLCHDMAALLLTTTIQHSLSMKRPIFVLLLDAKSAFDLVLRQILVRRLFLDSPQDQRIIYWDKRLANRTTYCQWEDQLMGPIRDQLGLEQGGPNSSEFYKIYNNEQLSSAQKSGFGASVYSNTVAAIGQADDSALVSHDLTSLQHLLSLSLEYCREYQVQLSTSKTKLLCYSSENSDYIKYAKLINPMHIEDETIPFSDTAEHVGVIRSPGGNLPHIHQRLVSHKKALGAILFTGMSRRHRANPLAAIRAEKIFGSPVLFSGLPSLILSKGEIELISAHVKQTLEGLLKLHPKTPEPVVFLISGTMPAEATLHMKQLTLFGMICRIPENILHRIAKEALIHSDNKDKSWFGQIRSLCYMYGLPNPLSLLNAPPPKDHFKKILKLKIADLWQSKLRFEAQKLKSLKYFYPEFMSITHPHPILTTAGTAYEVNKMITQLRMLSGRYRVGSLLRHFSPTHSGMCELCESETEDLPHLLVPRCPKLQNRREALLEFSFSVLSKSEEAINIFNKLMASNEHTQVQFLLDCSVFSEVIHASQKDSEILSILFKVTRTWCYSMHRARLKLLNRWCS